MWIFCYSIAYRSTCLQSNLKSWVSKRTINFVGACAIIHLNNSISVLHNPSRTKFPCKCSYEKMIPWTLFYDNTKTKSTVHFLFLTELLSKDVFSTFFTVRCKCAVKRFFCICELSNWWNRCTCWKHIGSITVPSEISCIFQTFERTDGLRNLKIKSSYRRVYLYALCRRRLSDPSNRKTGKRAITTTFHCQKM